MTTQRTSHPQQTAARSSTGSGQTGYRAFLRRAVRNPGKVGAVAPSSAWLAREMSAVVPGSGAPVVVELGPGTGSLSHAIAARLPSAGRHIAVELDPGMARYLRTELPWLEVLEGDAAELGSLLQAAGIESIDAVVSGLPWSIFPAAEQRAILQQVGGALAPGAAFTTFAYLHALGMSGARGFRGRLDESFDEVLTSRTIWRNVPPARFYTCRRPKP